MPETPCYPFGPIRVSRNLRLTPEEQVVEERFARLINQNTEEKFELYLSEHGFVVDTDRARRLSPDFRSSEDCARWSRATYNPAKAFADALYFKLLPRGVVESVVFTSGGTGAGKTTALAALGDQVSVRRALAVDGTLSDFEAACEKIDAALETEKPVVVTHVHTDFRRAVRQVISRALENGRVVTLDNIAATHFSSQATFRRLVRRYEKDPGVRLQVLIVAELELLEGGRGLGRMTEHVSIDHLRAEAERLFNEEYASLARSHPKLAAAFRARGSRVA